MKRRTLTSALIASVLLPAASLSHMGMFATCQAYEQLLMHLFASPLPEARDRIVESGRVEPGIGCGIVENRIHTGNTVGSIAVR